MYTTQLATPRSTGLFKRPGNPRIYPPKLPRGVLFASVFSSPDWAELTTGWPVAARNASLSVSAWGSSIGCAGASEYVSYLYPPHAPTRFSLEAIIYLRDAYASGTICGWNQASDGSNSTGDRRLSISAQTAGKADLYIYDGSSKVVTSATLISGNFYQIVGTVDGSNINIYVNGALSGGPVPAGDATPSFYSNWYLLAGRCIDLTNTFSGNLLSMIMTKQDIVWTPGEIMARYADPYSWLIFPEDAMSSLLVGVAAGGIGIPVWLYRS